MNICGNTSRRLVLPALLAAFLSAALAAHGQELITNGDFATGDLTGWTPYVVSTGTFGAGFPIVSGTFPTVVVSGSIYGSNSVELQEGNTSGNNDLTGAGLSQTITVPDNTDGNYTFSAYIASYAPAYGNTQPGTFSLLLDGTTEASFTMSSLSGPGGREIEYPDPLNSILSASLSGIAPGTYQVAIEIDRNLGYFSGSSPYQFVSDVSFLGDAVPEPSVDAFIIAGILFLIGSAFWRRRNTKKQQPS